jgi:hypothetical protein
MSARAAQSLRFLLCKTTCNVGDLSSSDKEWVFSPIQCLDKTVDGKPGIIVIHFSRMPTRKREALLELCAALKRNSHTRQCPLLALLHSRRRKLIEDLGRAKADYIRYIGDAGLASIQVGEIIEALGPEDRLARHLERICPFLHYSETDSQYEMTICGACLDRMALGGSRLHEICETEDHLHCEYYLNSRRES